LPERLEVKEEAYDHAASTFASPTTSPTFFRCTAAERHRQIDAEQP
jgi:hypothetical protein